MSGGIASRRILETPVAVLDFETTGLNAGIDRVVEISVVRMEPGRKPELVLDTLVNPSRPMAATEIHGITDEDVKDAPEFEQIAGQFVAALSGCVLAAYNVYFDIRFLEYELRRVGILDCPPHLCLMYLRPMLGLGCRCRLGEACMAHGIAYGENHIAAEDAQVSAQLMGIYLREIRHRNIRTFGELAALKNYKFVHSFGSPPLRPEAVSGLATPDRLRSRSGFPVVAKTARPPVVARAASTANRALGIYWESLKAAVADLVITDEEIEHLKRTEEQLGLKPEQVRVLHARAFASIISQFIDDQWLDDHECRKLKRLHQCLSLLGWAPGE